MLFPITSNKSYLLSETKQWYIAVENESLPRCDSDRTQSFVKESTEWE
jgi:hypothetical protein